MTDEKAWTPKTSFSADDVISVNVPVVTITCPCGVGSCQFEDSHTGRVFMASAADTLGWTCGGCGRVLTMLNGALAFVEKKQ